ncbi:MAG: maltotransferase domain-containing protein, partial [Acidimicrobiales bacterium]
MWDRIVIDDMRPRTPSRAYPAKAAVGEAVPVSADIFVDGHDLLAARVRTPAASATGGKERGGVAPAPLGNHRL